MKQQLYNFPEVNPQKWRKAIPMTRINCPLDDNARTVVAAFWRSVLDGSANGGVIPTIAGGMPPPTGGAVPERCAANLQAVIDLFGAGNLVHVSASRWT